MVKTDSMHFHFGSPLFPFTFFFIYGYGYLAPLTHQHSSTSFKHFESPDSLCSNQMAFRKLFSKRAVTNDYRVASPAVALDHSSPIKSLTTPQNNAASKTKLFKEFLTGDSVDIGFFRRFLHRRAIRQLPEFMSMPVGEKLREKLISGDRLHLDGLTPPEEIAGEANKFGISVENVKKILRFSLVEKLKAKLREIPRGSICYSEFVKICVDECGNEGQGVEFAKLLDQSGNVIVLGNIVFLRPEQVLILFFQLALII